MISVHICVKMISVRIIWMKIILVYENNIGKYNLYVDNLGSRISMKVIVMVDVSPPNRIN